MVLVVTIVVMVLVVIIVIAVVIIIGIVAGSTMIIGIVQENTRRVCQSHLAPDHSSPIANVAKEVHVLWTVARGHLIPTRLLREGFKATDSSSRSHSSRRTSSDDIVGELIATTTSSSSSSSSVATATAAYTAKSEIVRRSTGGAFDLGRGVVLTLM